MGNVQHVNESKLISRPYHAACRNIAETLPVTYILSYQRPEEYTARDANNQLSSQRSELRSTDKGCCLSPMLASQMISPRRDSFWDYGERLDNGENMMDYGDIQSTSGIQVENAKEQKELNKENQTMRTQNGGTKAKKLSLAERTIVKVPVFGNINNHKPFLESQVLDHLLPFILDSTLANCLRTCPHWLRTIYSHIKLKCAPFLESFQRTYCHGHLEYEGSGINIQPLFTAEVSPVRIDLLIYCKVLPPCQNRCTQIGYSFTYATTPTPPVIPHPNESFQIRCIAGSDDDEVDDTCLHSSVRNDPLASIRLAPDPLGSSTSTLGTIIPPISSSYNTKPLQREYQAQFRFETIKKGSKRTLWIQRDMCRFHGDELMIASMANVPTVCVDDRIEIPVTISNAFGSIDFNSISWLPLEYVVEPYRQFGQRCELERPKQLWVGLDQFQPTTSERLQNNDHFGPQWKHLKTEFTGIDITLSRSFYVAMDTGEVPYAKRWLGLEACVKPPSSPIVCALPRLGLQHDRFSMQQFRKIDILRRPERNKSEKLE